MKPMQGIQWVNCASFFMFVLTEFSFCSLHTHRVCVWTQRTGHTHSLPHQTPPVSNGSLLSRPTKTMVEIKRAHKKKKSLFYFFWQNLKSLCQSNRVCIWISKQTIKDCYRNLQEVYSSDMDFCKESACSHHHRTFEKIINVAINLLCNACLLSLFFFF